MTSVTKCFQEPQKCPAGKNSTFVPRDVEIERFEDEILMFLLFIYNFYKFRVRWVLQIEKYTFIIGGLLLKTDKLQKYSQFEWQMGLWLPFDKFFPKFDNWFDQKLPTDH